MKTRDHLYWKVILILVLSCNQHRPSSPEERSARSYYVSNSGNDNGKGDIKDPWKTLPRLRTVRLMGGDSVFLKGMEVFEGNIILKEVEGVKMNPVVITSYGNGTAVINARDSFAVQLYYSAYVEISRLILIGSGRKKGNTGDGLSLLSSNNIRLDSLDISGFQNAGLAVYVSSHVEISNVHAYENGYAGISVMGSEQGDKKSCSNIHIAHCNAENNPGSPVILNNHSGNGIVAGFCSKVTIEYCQASENGWDMPRVGNGPVGIWLFEADSSLIAHCVSHNNKTSKGGDDGGGFDLDGGVTNSVIEYCESYENQGSGYGMFQYRNGSPWYNNTLRFNSSRNDGWISAARSGAYIWNNSGDSLTFKNCLFHDNTIYNDKEAAISFASESLRSGFKFYNNKLTGKGKVITDRGIPCADMFSDNQLKSL